MGITGSVKTARVDLMSERIHTFDQWQEEFKPITSRHSPWVFDRMPSHIPVQNAVVWSIIEVEGDKFLINKKIDDALGYMITAFGPDNPTLAQYKYN